MEAESPPVLLETLAAVMLEKGRGFYVRAGRSSSSRPPGTSASADAGAVRALVAVKSWLHMVGTLTEFAGRCKGRLGQRKPASGNGIIATR
jgi:hypothetical protein